VDDFSVYGDSFEHCLANLGKVSRRCWDKKLTRNWEKCHFMVKRRIVLGHIISSEGLEVDKVKVDLIVNLPLPTYVKDVQSFPRHARFYR